MEYGFALQGWILEHFRILAIMESAAEPWFEDARVKTCITILQRCESESERMANRVPFVRFKRPLAEIIGIPAGKNEATRHAAVEALRDRILATKADYRDQDLRIIIKSQEELWRDGVRAGRVLSGVENGESADGPDADESEENDSWVVLESNGQTAVFSGEMQVYRAGKWGRYLRAPDVYFDIMRRFGNRFVPLGEIADIRRGITSGCDAFFMPKDVTAHMLDLYRSDKIFRENAGGAPRKDVASGKLKIIEAGDGSVHPIEARYLAPEVHSLMKVDRPTVRAVDLDRVVLLVSEPMDKLKTKAPWVYSYIRYGMKAPFASSKSGPVPVPERSTCAARDPWYNLTGLVRPGIAFWPMAQQYRHIIAGNPERLICNHNLFDVAPADLSATESRALVAVLNSTIVGLFKTFYGRFAGTEGNLKTEVVDVNLLEVPDPRGVSPEVAQRLAGALARMSKREVGRLVEEQLMDCHSPDRARRIAAGPLVLSHELQKPDRRDLDDAVLELLGVHDQAERDAIIDRLYSATARHFRDIRVVEIEKMQQRSKADNHRFSVPDLAADIWDAAELEDATPLTEWIGHRPESDSLVNIPEDRPANLSTDVMFSPNTVNFGRIGGSYVNCQSRGQAELVACLANLGVSGEVKMPAQLAPCIKLLQRVNERMDKARARFKELAESRTGDEQVRGQLMEVLERWFAVGREGPGPSAPT